MDRYGLVVAMIGSFRSTHNYITFFILRQFVDYFAFFAKIHVLNFVFLATNIQRVTMIVTLCTDWILVSKFSFKNSDAHFIPPASSFPLRSSTPFFVFFKISCMDSCSLLASPIFCVMYFAILFNTDTVCSQSSLA